RGGLKPMVLLVDEFSNILKEALGSLYQELSKTQHPDHSRSWWRREYEIVSLFAFKHLAPILQRQGIDPGVLRIAGRTPQLPTETDKKRRARRDLVVWADCLDTVWRPGIKFPLALLEWKISTSKTTPPKILTGRKDSVEADIAWLTHNSRLMGVGYSVFVEWPRHELKI